MSNEGFCANTDKEIYRDYDSPSNAYGYAGDSIFVTERGGIGFNVGGHCIVLPLREWHKLAHEGDPVNVNRQKEEIPKVYEVASKVQAPYPWPKELYGKLADDLANLCCAETEGKFFDLVTDNIDNIIEALRIAASVSQNNAEKIPSVYNVITM
jgi:hypothetical protein